MREIDLIHRQLELTALSVGSRVRRLYDALDGLAFLTKSLFQQVPLTDEDVQRWIKTEKLAELPSGWFESPERVEIWREKKFDVSAGTMFWAAHLKDDPIVARHFCLLQTMMPHACELFTRLKITWLYFQQARSPFAAIAIPAAAPDALIPPTFNWHVYHSFTAVEPSVNPERETRWTPPHIDHAGAGLIACVSKPVYSDSGEFWGVWTIDVKVSELHADLALEPVGNVGKRQTNFLSDFQGQLLAHPDFDPSGIGEKGAVNEKSLASLGGEFASLDVQALSKKGQGELELTNANGERLVVAFRTVPEIEWIIFASFPKADMIEATQAAFKQAFAKLGSGDFSVQIDAVADENMQQLVASYNETMQVLQESLLRREEAQQKALELAVAKEAADRANQAKSDFLSSMSHELRTPLNAILGYAQILERSETASASDKAGVAVIKKSGDHLLMLINDVLDLAKIEASKMDLMPREFNFGSFLRTVTNISRVRADQKHIKFTAETRGPLLENVYFDEKRLMQVLLNLLSNAIKFTDTGGVHLHTEIAEEAGPGGERAVKFVVTDTGAGIAAEHLANIFEPFEQVGDDAKKSEGTGLGLAITKKIVAQMGGKVEVQSEVGNGSTFTVSLTMKEISQQTSKKNDFIWETIVGYQGVRRLILVVDDYAPNRAVVQGLLGSLGFDIIEAENGEAALEIAPAKQPNFILMDIAMPGIDGCETTRLLRKIDSLATVPIVACSASLSATKRDETMRAGCNDFLAKPIDARSLFETLERFMNIEWVRKAGDEAAILKEREPVEVVHPNVPNMRQLLELANDGLLQDVVARADRLEQEDQRLGPWLRTIRQLAFDCEVDNLCARIEADMAHASA